MDRNRKLTLAAGLFYIGTFVTSIPALGLYAGILDDPNWVLGSGRDGGVLWGGLLEVLTGLAGIGSAIAVYPIIRRHAPGRALGFVASRTLEAAMIFAGVLAVLTVYTLRQHGGDPTTLTTTAGAFVAFKDWTFLLGPGLAATVNALCFATVLRRTRLVPQWIPTLGVIGAPLLAFSSTVTLFGGWDQDSSTGLLFVLPIAVWEISVGFYMAVKGFRTPSADIDPSVDSPSPVLAAV